MNKFYYFIIVFFVAYSLTSCDKINSFLSEDDYQTENNTSYSSSSSSDNENKEKLDSIEATENTKIDSIASNVVTTASRLDSLEDVVYSKQNEIEELNSKIKELEIKKISLLQLFIYLVAFSIILVILVVYIAQRVGLKKTDIDSKIKNHENICHGQYNNVNANHNGQSIKSAQDIRELNVKFDELKNKYTYLMARIDPLLNPSAQVYIHDSSLGKQPNVTTKDDIKKIDSREFYMERPLKENEFDLSLRKENPTEDTCYKFKLDKHNNSKATFKFETVSPQAASRALNTRDKTIDPVCDVTIYGNTGQYKCDEGEATLKDGKWIVTKKAHVIFN